MPAITDRGEGNRKRKDRQAQLKKGPGVFVYDGKALDHSCEPTPLLTSGKQPVFDASGMPVADRSGRQVYERAGQFVRDNKGNLVLGGPPKISTKPIATWTIGGVDFP